MQLHTVPPRCAQGVPIRQISRTRTTYKSRTLCYEVMLTTDKPWSGFSICSKLSRSGVRLACVTYAEGGCLYLKLLDDGATNLGQLAEVLDSNEDVTVSRWTTIVPL